MSSDLTGRDQLTVVVDGEEVEVWNSVSVSTHHFVNSVNGYETFEPSIAMGDMGVGPAPEAVTERVADLLRSEWHIDVEDLDDDIRVIDPDDEEVDVL